MIPSPNLFPLSSALLEEGERRPFVVPQLLVKVGRRRRRCVLRRVVEGLHALHWEVLAPHQHLSTAHHRAEG